MPIDLSYIGIVNDIVLKGGIGLVLIAIVAYRLLAASALPFLAHKSLYCFFCFVIVAAFLSLSPCVEKDSIIEAIILILLLFAPCLCFGFIGLLRKWNLKRIIVFATLELVLFPLWFFIVFTAALFLDGGE